MSRLNDWILNLNPKKFYLYSLVFFILLSSAIRFPVFFFDFFSNDEAAHFTGSLILEDNKTLYKDFADNKPPIIYILYLLCRKLISDDIFSVHLATSTLIIPLIALFISIFVGINNRIQSLLAGSFYIIFSSSFIPTDMLSTNCEIPMLFFSSLMFLFIKRVNPIYYFLGGLFLSLAILSKQQAGIWLLVPVIFIALQVKEERRYRLLLLIIPLLIGLIIPLLIAALYFDSKGALNEFLYYNIIHNIYYTKNPITVSEIFKRFLKYLLPFLIVISPLFYFYFYKECQLRPASRFILPQASISGYIPGNESSYKEGFESKRYIIKRYREELIEGLITNKPELIVDTSPSGFHHWDRYGLNTFPELKGFIDDGYYLFKDINGFHLYLRR